MYSQADAFSKLSAAATKVAQQQGEMPAGDVASMYIALLGFTGKVCPDKLDFTNRVLTECYQASSLHFVGCSVAQSHVVCVEWQLTRSLQKRYQASLSAFVAAVYVMTTHYTALQSLHCNVVTCYNTLHCMVHLAERGWLTIP